MNILRATSDDLNAINKLLYQVLSVHHEGRPDIFRGGVKKYTDAELLNIIADDSRPIFVAKDDGGEAMGYAFCVFQQHNNDNILTNIKTLYIDDLCVDENCRGKHIGKALYDYVVHFAKQNECYNVTLNVWALNDNAIKFYEACGMKIQKIGMETVL